MKELKPIFKVASSTVKYDITHYSANVYLFKCNNRNTRKRCEICLKLTVKTPEQRR